MHSFLDSISKLFSLSSLIYAYVNINQSHASTSGAIMLNMCFRVIRENEYALAHVYVRHANLNITPGSTDLYVLVSTFNFSKT